MVLCSSQDANAIGYISLVLKHTVKALKIDGVEATEETIVMDSRLLAHST